VAVDIKAVAAVVDIKVVVAADMKAADINL
jgi:hypothetical protein